MIFTLNWNNHANKWFTFHSMCQLYQPKLTMNTQITDEWLKKKSFSSTTDDYAKPVNYGISIIKMKSQTLSGLTYHACPRLKYKLWEWNMGIHVSEWCNKPN